MPESPMDAALWKRQDAGKPTDYGSFVAGWQAALRWARTDPEWPDEKYKALRDELRRARLEPSIAAQVARGFISYEEPQICFGRWRTLTTDWQPCGREWLHAGECGPAKEERP